MGSGRRERFPPTGRLPPRRDEGKQWERAPGEEPVRREKADRLGCSRKRPIGIKLRKFPGFPPCEGGMEGGLKAALNPAEPPLNPLLRKEGRWRLRSPGLKLMPIGCSRKRPYPSAAGSGGFGGSEGSRPRASGVLRYTSRRRPWSKNSPQALPVGRSLAMWVSHRAAWASRFSR